MPQGVPSFGKFGPEAQKVYLANLRAGQKKFMAQRGTGCSDELIRLYRNDHPEFAREEAEAVRFGSQMRGDEIEDALYRAATHELNVTAIQVYLYNRRPGRWKDKRNVGKEAPDLDLTKLTDAELLEWKRLADKAAKGGKEGGPDAPVENGRDEKL